MSDADPLPAVLAAEGPVLPVVAGLVFRQGRLLISQRRPDDHLGGLWEFPGGKVESGEAPTEGLCRELREELDVEVEVGDLIAEVAHAYPERRVRIQFFRCRLLHGEPMPRHCAAVAWVTPAELDRYPFPAADARLLERLRTEPGLWRNA